MVPIPEPMRDEVLKGLNETVLPARFAQLERALKKSGGPYFCGEDMMSCDISFYVARLHQTLVHSWKQRSSAER